MLCRQTNWLLAWAIDEDLPPYGSFLWQIIIKQWSHLGCIVKLLRFSPILYKVITACPNCMQQGTQSAPLWAVADDVHICTLDGMR